MTSLVVGDKLPLPLRHHGILLLKANGNALKRIADVILVNFCLVLPSCHNGSLVQQVGKIRTAHTRCLPGHRAQIHRRCQRLALGMDLQDGDPTLDIWWIHLNLTVESARSHKRLVQDVRPVCGCDDNDAIVNVETIHLSQELVDSLFPLIIPLAKASTSLSANCINFINEDDARGSLLSLGKEVSHTCCADACEHLNEFRRGN
mmetsp:Transcript_58143/g.135964  ORF Transcript_58143/g.135964 Transcript_58143/m.135964 type:complete len:204 (-) Transcript_58143:1119-1730(-)